MPKQPLQTLVRHLHQLVRPPDSGAADDRDLLARFVKRRDSAAFAALVQRHGPMVRGVCRRLLRQESDVDDAFQATFLVLLRKAHTIRKSRSVGSWLYGVAYRIASRLRSQQRSEGGRGSRRAIPGKARQEPRPPENTYASPTGGGTGEGRDPSMEAAWRELCAVLDAEVHALSEKFRAPLILCYLEEQTRDQAARQLGCPLRTLDRRLEQGRERLRARLARRGITLSAALLTTGLSQRLGIAALPPALVEQTIQAACGLAAGQAAAAASISPKAIVLAEVALKGAVPMQLKVVAGVFLLAVVAVGGAGALAHQMLTAKPQAASEANDSKPAIPVEKQAKDDRAKPVRNDLYGDPLPPGAVARLGTARLRHQAGLYPSIAFSPDGKVLASTSRGTISLRDVATGHQIPPLFPNFANWVDSLALSPDGQIVAAGVGDTIRVLQMATGKELKQFETGNGPIAGLAFSPDGKTLASGCGSGQLKLWNVDQGKEVRTLQGHTLGVTTVAFAPDTKTLASGSQDKTVRLWELSTGKELRQLTSYEYEVHGVAFSPDSKTVATVGGDIHLEEIRLFEAASGKELPQFKGNKLQAWSVVFSLDGKTLFVGAYHNIYFFDVASGKELRRVGKHQESIHCLALSPDGKILGAASGDNTLSLWNTATGKEQYSFKGHQGHIGSVAFSKDGKMVASGDWGTVRIWKAANGELIREFPVETLAWLSSLVFSPDGKLMAYGSCNGPRRLWDVASWKEFAQGDDVKSRAACLAFSPDGKTLASVEGYGNLAVDIWDVFTGKRIRQCVGHKDRVYCVVFSPDGKTMLSASYDKTIRLWNVATGLEIRQFLGHSKGVKCIALSPDGKTLASRSWGEPILLWEVATGGIRLRFTGSEFSGEFVKFSPDGSILASGRGTDEEPIRLWDVAIGKELANFKGHLDDVTSITFSPDGKRLVTGSADSTALIWDVSQVVMEKPSAGKTLQDKELETLWAELADGVAGNAYQAIGQLIRASKQAVPYLKTHLQPVRPIDSSRIAPLLIDLDSNQFAVRERADKELLTMGDLALPALRKELSGRRTLEVRRRIERLLQRIEKGPSEVIGALRSIEVLEHIGTPEAEQVLKTLATGAPEARLTQEANAALERLVRKSASTP